LTLMVSCSNPIIDCSLSSVEWNGKQPHERTHIWDIYYSSLCLVDTEQILYKLEGRTQTETCDSTFLFSKGLCYFLLLLLQSAHLLTNRLDHSFAFPKLLQLLLILEEGKRKLSSVQVSHLFCTIRRGLLCCMYYYHAHVNHTHLVHLGLM